MKETGIIRKVDQTGRIALPIEIRKSLNIKDGENIEILVKDGTIILRPYQLDSGKKIYDNLISQLSVKAQELSPEDEYTQNKIKELYEFLRDNKSKFTNID